MHMYHTNRQNEIQQAESNLRKAKRYFVSIDDVQRGHRRIQEATKR